MSQPPQQKKTEVGLSKRKSFTFDIYHGAFNAGYALSFLQNSLLSLGSAIIFNGTCLTGLG